MINTNNLPLGSTINPSNNNQFTLTSLNNTIPVLIDNKQYYINSTGLQLQLTYGYHIIQFPSYYNITFNYTSTNYQGAYNTMPIKDGTFMQNGKVTIQGGQINCYQFTSLSTNTSKINIINSYTVFVNGSGKIIGNYQLDQTYYLVIAENYFYFPQGIWASYNSTPVNISIGAQPLQVQVLGTNQVITLGNINNYVPEKIYFKNGTELEITLDYLQELSGYFKIVKVGNYTGLLSYPQKVTIYNVTYENGYTYHPEAQSGNYGIMYINSPLIIINYEEWEYGAIPNGGNNG